MKKILSVLLVLVLSITLLSGCEKKEEKPKETKEQKTETKAPEKKETEKKETKKQEKISIVGSTSVTPVMEKLAEAYMNKNKNVSVEVQGVGSSAGVKSAYEKTSDIGMSSRNLKEKEKEWKLTEDVLGFDGIAISVHPKNKVKELSLEQAQKIFKGEIKNWKEVGGEDKEIIVISREAGSGTKGAFEELTKLKDKVSKNALVAEGNGSVKANIASKENAIGYLSLSYVDKSVQAVKIDSVEPTVENIKKGDYKIARPFLLLTNGEKSEKLKKFFEFIESKEGQEIVGKTLVTK